jgi:hypothetical protein
MKYTSSQLIGSLKGFYEVDPKGLDIGNPHGMFCVLKREKGREMEDDLEPFEGPYDWERAFAQNPDEGPCCERHETLAKVQGMITVRG